MIGTCMSKQPFCDEIVLVVANMRRKIQNISISFPTHIDNTIMNHIAIILLEIQLCFSSPYSPSFYNTKGIRDHVFERSTKLNKRFETLNSEYYQRHISKENLIEVFRHYEKFNKLLSSLRSENL